MPEPEDDKGKKTTVLTDAEIKKIADDAIAEQKAADVKVKEEEEEKKRLTNMSLEQATSFIDSLKDENAKRRIANKKLQDKIDKQGSDLVESSKKLDSAMEKIDAFDKKSEAEKNKDLSDLEIAKTDLEKSQKALDDSQKELSTTRSQLSKRESQLEAQRREIVVDKLVTSMDHSYSSEFERTGLMSTLSAQDEEGIFKLTTEEVIIKVKEFVAKSKTRVTTPGPGPKTRQTDTPLGKEVEALLSKKELTEDDQKRLDELIAIAGTSKG